MEEFIFNNGPGQGGARYYTDDQGDFWGHPLDPGDMGEYLWYDQREYLGAGTWAAAQRSANSEGNRAYAAERDGYGRGPRRRRRSECTLSLYDDYAGIEPRRRERPDRRSRDGPSRFEALTNRVSDMGRRARTDIEDFSDRFDQRHQRVRDRIHGGMDRALDSTLYRAADGLEQGFRNLNIRPGRSNREQERYISRREPPPVIPYDFSMRRERRPYGENSGRRDERCRRRDYRDADRERYRQREAYGGRRYGAGGARQLSRDRVLEDSLFYGSRPISMMGEVGSTRRNSRRSSFNGFR